MSIHGARWLRALLAVTVSLGLALGGASAVVDAPMVPDESVEFRGQLFVTGNSLSQWPTGLLYSFDGATFTSIDDTYHDVVGLQVINDVLYYAANDGTTWYVLAYDGTTVSQTGLESPVGPIEFLGYETGILALVPMGISDYRLVSLNGGVPQTVDLFEDARGLTYFDGLVYFTGTPAGGSGSETDRTDGVTVQHDVLVPASNKFAWQGALYFGNVGQQWAFSKMFPDLSISAAANPPIEFPNHYLPAGDILYFAGTRDNDEYVFSFDGASATQLPGGLRVVGDLQMFNGQLFVSDVSPQVTVCGGEVSVQCESDVVYVYYFDGTSWVQAATAHNSLGGLMSFQNRLYFQDGAKWMFIEPATLANTGVAVSPGLSVAAMLVALGFFVATVAQRRRRIARSTTG